MPITKNKKLMLIGHEKTIQNLKNLADKNQLSHGYIFFGPPRTGKKTVALGLANYLETGNFDNPSLLVDSFLIQPDENLTIGIDAVRKIKNFLWRKPVKGIYRTLIIDGCESLTNEAQNALLKITEEPPASSLIILAMVEPEILLPTISSRFQKIYFPQVDKKFIKDWLQKEFNCAEKEAGKLSEDSCGQPGLAWSMLKDGNFRDNRNLAQELLKTNAWEQRDFIKKLVEKDDFSFKNFLDILLLELSVRRRFDSSEIIAFWHKTAALRRQMDYFNLNPRLQLESLLMTNNQ